MTNGIKIEDVNAVLEHLQQALNAMKRVEEELAVSTLNVSVFRGAWMLHRETLERLIEFVEYSKEGKLI